MNHRNHYKTLFLIDGAGALLTAVLLFAVLPRLDAYFGMPKHILYLLSAIACVFAVYSLSCYFFTSKNYKPFLKAIAIANTLYCLLTAILLVVYYTQLTIFDFTYFILEMMVIGCLVFFEKRSVISATNTTIMS